MTPYCSGFPIEYIPTFDPIDPDCPRQRQVYHIIFVYINWMATCTHPDIDPALTFIDSYSNSPHPQHYKAAVHALKYLTSTNEYDIYFYSQSSSTIQSFNHFTYYHDKEAYTEATDSTLSECHHLTSFCDANWGGQFGSAVKDGTPIELFKLRSLSVFIICCSGGPIVCKSIRQNQTALVSCEAEIMATNESAIDPQSPNHRANDIGITEA